MIRTIRAARYGRAAISEVWAGRVAERPTAHRLPQLNDRHPKRHRQHNALVKLRLGLDLSSRRNRERRRAANDARSDRGGRAGRRGAMDSLLGRRRAGTRRRRTRRLGAACETQPMNFANNGVAGQAVTEQCCDLARALALDPVLPKLLHSFIRPGHGCLVLRLEPGASAESLPGPDDAIRRAKREPAFSLKPSPRHLVAICGKTTLLVESRAESVALGPPAFQQVSAPRRLRRVAPRSIA